MEYIKLGKTGLSVSRICLGCMSYGDKRSREWVISAEDARAHFAAALETGVNFFDTADVYSTGVSEEITGRWLGEMAARDEIVLATKVNGPMGPGPNRRGLSRKHRRARMASFRLDAEPLQPRLS
jgi:aryl-alcohol dehydrogenase-like predicted oxidoreductase